MLGASAEYGTVNMDDPYREGESFGSSFSHDEAMIKAIAEGIERYYSSEIRIDVYGNYNELDNTVHPNQIAPTHPQSSKFMDTESFDENRNYGWVKGTRIASMEEALVLPEFIYYPTPPKYINRKQVFEGCSNGTAAHTMTQKAIEGGLLELIERDALMVTWFAEKEVTSIPHRQVDPRVRQRIEKWEEKGFSIKLLNITLDSVPVVLAISHHKDHFPRFASGAAAHYNWQDAIRKSFDELELQLLTWQEEESFIIKPSDVKHPNDHGLLYAQEDSLNHIEWLVRAKDHDIEDTHLSFKDLLIFDPIVFTLKEKDDENDLTVVKVVSENLIPINFGYGTEHINHKRFKELGIEVKKEYPSFPHFFA